jgi:hypothetical protein
MRLALLLCLALGLGGCGITAEKKIEYVESIAQSAGDRAYEAAYKLAISKGLSEELAQEAGTLAKIEGYKLAKAAAEKSIPVDEGGGGKLAGGLLATLLQVGLAAVGGRRS